MAQMRNQKTEGHADLLLKIERRRRLAKQVPDIKTAQQLLELATEYLKQLIKAKIPFCRFGRNEIRTSAWCICAG
jgi:hypothetical protein